MTAQHIVEGHSINDASGDRPNGVRAPLARTVWRCGYRLVRAAFAIWGFAIATLLLLAYVSKYDLNVYFGSSLTSAPWCSPGAGPALPPTRDDGMHSVTRRDEQRYPTLRARLQKDIV
jgi:hypothetical protein